MTEIQKKHVLTLLAIVLAVAFFLPVLFGAEPEVSARKGEDSWRNFVYEFQTLITGILAIGAAYFTISQSRIIDERQQKRHEELFELQLRPDKLRVARANIVFYEIQMYGKFVSAMALPDYEAGFDHVNEKTILDAVRFQQVCEKLIEQLDSEQIVGVRDLFDGDLNDSFNNLTRRLRQLERHLKWLSANDGDTVQLELGPGISGGFPMNASLREETWTAAQRLRSAFNVYYEDFCLGFKNLRQQFKVG